MKFPKIFPTIHMFRTIYCGWRHMAYKILTHLDDSP